MIRRFMDWLQGQQPSNMVRIPLPTKGKLYVSPMPWGPYDPRSKLIKDYRHYKIKAVLTMVIDEEIRKKCKKKNLLQFYKEQGYAVYRIPFQDLSAPPLEQVTEVLPQVLESLESGNHTVIHCNAGVGRTGILAACISAQVFRYTGPQAIDYVKGHMMVNLTSEQQRIIEKWADLASNNAIGSQDSVSNSESSKAGSTDQG